MVALTINHGLEPYYRRELLARFATAGASIRKRGREWYPTARAILADIAARTGYTLEQAVAVLAITSPGVQVKTNLEWAERALTTRGAVPVGRFPNVMAPKIRAVLDDAEFAREYVSGPKVGAFFRAILGANELVLDRWATFAATSGIEPRDELTHIRPRARQALVAAYSNAARQARMRVRDFQAAVWIQSRESTPMLRRGKYVPVRLADITSN